MRAIFLVVLALATIQVHAQSARRAARAESAANTARANDAHQQLGGAEAEAAASAARPGDDALSCEALKTEFLAISQDPQMGAFVQANGAQAQEKIEQLNQAQEAQAAQPRQGVLRSIVQGAASAVVPGLGQGAAMAQQTAQAAQAAQGQVQAQKNMQSMLGQTGQVSAMIGPLMRGQHLMGLAQARKCDWALQSSGATEVPSSAPRPAPPAAK